jgi:hypothetical protein
MWSYCHVHSIYGLNKYYMTPLEAVLKIKAMFEQAGANFAEPVLPAIDPAAAPAAEPAVLPIEAAKEYDLKSGGKVMIDMLEVGGLVTLIDEAGNTAPAPVGEHELVDGTIIILDEAGKILEIKSAQVEAPEVEIEITAPVEPTVAELKIKELEAAIDEIKKDAEMKKKMMSAADAKFSKAISDLSDVIVGMINTSSSNATENPKDKFNQHVESKDDKMKRFLDLAKNINK